MATNGPRSMLDGKPLLMLMDGHALVHRAWHAIREPLTVTRDGRGRAWGVRVRELVHSQPSGLGADALRHCVRTCPLPPSATSVFKDYKAHRPPTPPELRSQFERVRQLIDAFEVPVYQCEGYEADGRARHSLPPSRGTGDRDGHPDGRLRYAAVGLSVGARLHV